MTPEFNHDEMERHDIFIDEEPKFHQMEIEISSPENIFNLTSSDSESPKINLSQINEQKNMDLLKKKNQKHSDINFDEEETKENENQKIIIGNFLDKKPIEADQKNIDSSFKASETFIENKKALLKVKF